MVLGIDRQAGRVLADQPCELPAGRAVSQRRDLRASVTVPVWNAFCEKARAERLSPSSVLMRLVKEYAGLDRHGQPLPDENDDPS